MQLDLKLTLIAPALATAEKPIPNDANSNPQVTNDTVTASTFESEQNDEPTPTPTPTHSKIVYQNQIFQLKSSSLSLPLIHQEHVS